MRTHLHHLNYKCRGGDDYPENVEEVGFIEHAKIHAEEFLLGGPQFDFRHEGWPLLEEYLREAVIEEHSNNQRNRFLDGLAVSAGAKGGRSTAGRTISESNKLIHEEKDPLGRSKEAVKAGGKGGEATHRDKNEEGKSSHAVKLGLEHGWKGGKATSDRESRPVVCIETGEMFPSASEAARKTGIHQSSISRCCRKGGGRAGNLQWIYC